MVETYVFHIGCVNIMNYFVVFTLFPLISIFCLTQTRENTVYVTEKSLQLTYINDLSQAGFIKMSFLQILYEMRHAKTCLLAYTDSDGPDQPAHPRSLIRVFNVCFQNRKTLQNV